MHLYRSYKNNIYIHVYMYFNGEGNGTPLQYSCLENPMDGGAWWAAVHGVAKSQTRLSDFTFTFHFHALEKEMATHSSVLAWRIPGTGEPDGLPSMGSQSWTRLTQLRSSSSSSLVSQQSLSSLSSNFCSIGQWKVLQIGIRVLSLPALDYFRETMF